MKKIAAAFVVLACVSIAFLFLRAALDKDKLTATLDELRKKENLNGLAVILFKNEDILYEHGFGLLNKNPTDTIFQIASVSKVVTGLALMILFDQGKFKLDDPINNYLPKDMQLTNPKFPNTPITFRMMLTHTSSITDKEYNKLEGIIKFGADQEPSSREAFNNFIKDYYAQTGKYYNKGAIFDNTEPGKEEAYANVGTALIGYLVQVISNMPFDEFCKKYIFQPLGMNSTGWFLKDIDKTKLVQLEDNKTYLPQTFPDFPSGQLFTTLNDFSKLIMALMNGGSYKGIKILSPEGTKTMITTGTVAASPDYAMHVHEHTIGDLKLIGHEGDIENVSTSAMFDPQSHVGAIVFMNTVENKQHKHQEEDDKDVSLDPLVKELIVAGKNV